MIKRVLPIVMGSVALAAGCGQEVKMVEVDPPSVDFKKLSQSERITPKALDMRGGKVEGVSFEFRSENPGVATVTPDGLVKPAGNGSAFIVAETPTGVAGETFVKVCLPKELVCDPIDLLKLKVGTAGPVKCHVTNCRDEKIDAKIEYTSPEDGKQEGERLLLKEGENVFIGLKVGDTTVTAKAYDLEKTVKVHIDEQEYLPGYGPNEGGGGGGGGKKKGGGDSPYGQNRWDHILQNL